MAKAPRRFDLASCHGVYKEWLATGTARECHPQPPCPILDARGRVYKSVEQPGQNLPLRSALEAVGFEHPERLLSQVNWNGYCANDYIELFQNYDWPAASLALSPRFRCPTSLLMLGWLYGLSCG